MDRKRLTRSDLGWTHWRTVSQVRTCAAGAIMMFAWWTHTIVRRVLSSLSPLEHKVIPMIALWFASRRCGESVKIIKQAIEKIKKEPSHIYRADKVPWICTSSKEEVYNNMEALIYQFKISWAKPTSRKGGLLHCVGRRKRWAWFYLISDGGRTRIAYTFRRPCFIFYQAYPEMIKGRMLSDAIITMSK